MYIQYLYIDTWFKTKITPDLFAWRFRKSDIVLARVRLQSEDRPPRQTPGAEKKNVKNLAFSSKMRPNKSKGFIPTWTIQLPRTERGSPIARGQYKEKEKQRASYFLSSVSLILPISSISLNILNISWYLPVKTPSFGCQWNRTDRSNNSGQSQVTTGRN